jgi:hypothetical protein
MDEYRYSRTYTYLRQESRTPIQELEFLKYWSHYTNWQRRRESEGRNSWGSVTFSSGGVREVFEIISIGTSTQPRNRHAVIDFLNLE